jgi:hypothetical protein
LNIKIFGEHKFKENYNIVIDGGIDLSDKSFNRFRKNKWLDNLFLKTGIQISNKAPFIRCNLSVPLDPAFQFLARWGENVDAFVKKVQEILLILFCSLQIDKNHFTLLKINYRTKIIYHYDPKIKRKIIKNRIIVSGIDKIVKMYIIIGGNIDTSNITIERICTS